MTTHMDETVESMLPQQIPVWWDQERGRFPSGSVHGKSADFVIIGGGLAGLLAAFWLVYFGGKSVLLLEAGGIFEKASGRNGGRVNAGNVDLQGIHDKHGGEAVRSVVAFETESVGLLEWLLEEYGIRCGYQKGGQATLAEDAEGMRLIEERYEVMLSLDLPVEIWDQDRCLRETGVGRFVGALFSPNGGQLQSLHFGLGVARAAADLGAEIHVRTRVLGIRPHNDEFVVVTEGGNVQARHIIHATNRPFLGDGVSSLASKFVPVRGQVLATDPLPVRSSVVFDTVGDLVYWQQDPRGRLVIGGMRAASPNNEEGEEDDSVVHPLVGTALRRFLESLAVEARVTHEWTGIIWQSPDLLPVIGRSPFDGNQSMLIGLAGHGLPPVVKSAQALVRMLRGEEGGPPDLFAPRLDRFTRSV